MTTRLLLAPHEVHRQVDRRFGPFVRAEVNPGAEHRDAWAVECPRSLMRRAHDIGLFGLALPPELGGAGAGLHEWGLVLERLGYLSADAGFPALLSARVWVAATVAATGHPAHVERARAMARAEVFGSFAYSDVGDPFSFASTLQRSGGELVLTGEKPIVTGALGADVFMVFLHDVDTADLAVVLVERSDPGVDVVPVASMGVRSLGLGTLRMNRVVVPAGRLVAGADGLTFAQRMLNARRLLLAAGLVGGMRALHEHCVEQLMSTHRYGAPLAELPSVQAALGRQLITVCTAEATLHDALPLLDTGLADPQFDTHLSAAKHAITEAAVGLGLSALRLLGGRGYLRGPAERFLRDACAMLSAAGAQDVLEIGLGLRAVTDRRPQAAPDPLDLAARRLALAEAAR